MLLLPDRAGPANPVASSPTRRAGSARRTTSIDTSRPTGLEHGSVVDGRARDIVTGPSGAVDRHHEQRMLAHIAPNRELMAIEADPPEPRLPELLGTPVGPGFRARMAELLPDHARDQTLLYALLDDLPGATLVSGYAILRGSSDTPAARASEQHVRASEDMCAGWARDATIVVTFREKGSVPTPIGPGAPRLERDDDPLSWHPMDPLPREATRRRRRLDLLPPDPDSGRRLFNSHFRDSYRDAQGAESVVHEYVVDGSLDETGGRLGLVRADPRVLPWVECPGAIGSAARMAGRPLAELRSQVRTEFVGTSTCTHLNDTLRFLSDLIPLHALVPEAD
jgi:hypothetical protein